MAVLLVRSKRYSKNLEQGGHQSPCAVCGKPVENPRWWVHIVGGGALILEHGEPIGDPAADCGCFPVGSCCLRRNARLRACAFQTGQEPPRHDVPKLALHEQALIAGLLAKTGPALVGCAPLPQVEAASGLSEQTAALALTSLLQRELATLPYLVPTAELAGGPHFTLTRLGRWAAEAYGMGLDGWKPLEELPWRRQPAPAAPPEPTAPAGPAADGPNAVEWLEDTCRHCGSMAPLCPACGACRDCCECQAGQQPRPVTYLRSEVVQGESLTIRSRSYFGYGAGFQDTWKVRINSRTYTKGRASRDEAERWAIAKYLRWAKEQGEQRAAQALIRVFREAGAMAELAKGDASTVLLTLADGSRLQVRARPYLPTA